MAIKTTVPTEKESKSLDCTVLEKIGVISTNAKGETLELRYVSWNGNAPKYEIRPWFTDEDGNEKCRKGITLKGEELQKLLEILQAYAES